MEAHNGKCIIRYILHHKLKRAKWLRFERIEELRAVVQKEVKKLTKEVIASLTGWEFILVAISVAGL